MSDECFSESRIRVEISNKWVFKLLSIVKCQQKGPDYSYHGFQIGACLMAPSIEPSEARYTRFESKYQFEIPSPTRKVKIGEL